MGDEDDAAERFLLSLGAGPHEEGTGHPALGSAALILAIPFPPRPLVRLATRLATVRPSATREDASSRRNRSRSSVISRAESSPALEEAKSDSIIVSTSSAALVRPARAHAVTSARRTRASGGVVTSTPGLDELDLAVPDPSLDPSAVKSIKSPSSSFTRQTPSRLDSDRPVMVAYNALAPSTSPHRAYPSMNAPNVFRSGDKPDSIIAST